MKNHKLAITLTLWCLILSGCDTHVTQTTSGREYLSDYPTGTSIQPDDSFEEQLKEIASVEPTLQFPARIGIVRIENGDLGNLHESEASAWMKIRDSLGGVFGEFVPVSPLIADMVYEPTTENKYRTKPGEIIKKIRLAAARQHLDVVLIYEVFSQTETTTLASSVAAWTILGGYFIDSKKIETVGFANALLIDVRSGYPYGSASSSLEAERDSPFFQSFDSTRNLARDNEIATAIKLSKEVEKMMLNLMKEINGLPKPITERTATSRPIAG